MKAEIIGPIRLTDDAPSAPVTKRPTCEGVLTDQSLRHHSWRKGRDMPERTCSRQAVVTLDGKHYCAAHGGRYALRFLLSQQASRDAGGCGAD